MLSKKNPWFNKIVEYAFYVYLFLLPWQTRYIINYGFLNGPIEYGTYALYATDILLIIVFLLSWFYKNINPVETCHGKSLRGYNAIILLSIFAFISFFSVYWADNHELAFYAWMRIVGAIIFIFLLIKLNLSLTKISLSLIAAGFIQALLGIWQFFVQNIPAYSWLGMSSHNPTTLGDQVVETITGRFLRAYGSLPHPNILGGFLMACLLLIIFLALKNPTKIIKIFLAICLPIITAGLFFSFSRSAWIGFFIGWLFILFFIHWQHKILLNKFLKISCFLALTFTVLTLIYPNLIIGRVFLIDRLEKKSISERAEFQQQSLNIIIKNWPIGVGIGNYTREIYNKYDDNLSSYNYQPVHNIYLLLFAEIGIFGLSIFLLFIINSFKNINLTNLSSIAAGILLISFLIIGFFDHYLITQNFGLMLFFLPLGLLHKNCG